MSRNSFQPDQRLTTLIQSITPQTILTKNYRQLVFFYKALLTDINQYFDQLFLAGHAIDDLIHGRAWAIDHILQSGWAYSIDFNEAALFAIGGYGRAQLHPFSDIDLLIIVDENLTTTKREAIQQFIQLLWDCNLKVSQSVRTFAECVEDSQQDLTIMTSLLDHRLLVGKADWQSRFNELLKTTTLWPPQTFVLAKIDEQRSREHRYGYSEYSLEPNVKLSPGGLRNLQTIDWLAQRTFGDNAWQEIHYRHWLTAADEQLWQQGRQFLWRIRYGLHYLANRAEDRLLFDYQKKLAQLLGYQDQAGQLAVEQLMQDYYRTATQLLQLDDLFIQSFREVFQKQIDLSLHRQEPLLMINQILYTPNPLIFQQKPAFLLAIFVKLVETSSSITLSAATLRQLRSAIGLIDADFRQQSSHRYLFVKLLTSSGDVARQLTLMARYGILARYLPDFSRITGLMQYDLFHQFTVDAHTLRLLNNLQAMRDTVTARLYPSAAIIISQLPQLTALWIAGLFHDLAKGQGGQHALRGAWLTRHFCRQHQIKTEVSQLSIWLVRWHLLMSQTAQKQDLQDPVIIAQFARKVGNITRLNHLYLLTMADISATNPTLWNSWLSSLLFTLYQKTVTFLAEQPKLLDVSQQAAAKRQLALTLLIEQHYEPQAVERLWQTFGESYFLTYEVADIIWQTIGILTETTRPLVLFNPPTEAMTKGGTKAFIYAPNANYLFAATVAALDEQQINIQEARIATTQNDWALNMFTLFDAHFQPLQAGIYLQQLQQILIQRLQKPANYVNLNQRLTSRQQKIFTQTTHVDIYLSVNHQYHILELITADRPGLLARVGAIFAQQGIAVSMAKIATFGERAEDMFHITDLNLQPLIPAQLKELARTLCTQLDQSD